MNKSLIVSLVLGTLMVLSSVLTKALTPASPSASKTNINLETLIPSEFDDWKLDLSNASPIVNPGVRDELEKIYNQTLSRTYVNNEGERIMLVIAYGGPQKTDMHNHRPEFCYAANGFDLGKITETFINTGIGRVPVMHLVAKQGTRIEPITYWMRVGDSLTRGRIEQKLTAIGYVLSGKVADGVLVRVSSVSNDEQGSYQAQQVFLTAMLRAVQSEDRLWLVGHLTQ